MAAGRKRKAGEREPNGRNSRSSKPNHEPINGTVWQRLLRLRREGKVDPRATSEIARLHAESVFSDKHAIAALKIGEIYGRFERLLGVSRSVKGFSYDVGFRGTALLSEAEEAARDEREKKARTAFDALQADMKGYPRDLRDTIESLCVEDRHVLPIWHDDLRDFFSKLAVKWGVTAGQKQRGGDRPGSGRKPATLDATSSVVEKSAEPVARKVNTDRLALKQTVRAIEEGLITTAECWDYFTAAKDKLVYRAKTDRRRIEAGKGPGYVPPSVDITPAAIITDRPVLELPGQQEHA